MKCEFPEAGNAGHEAAVEHKESVIARFRELARDAGAARPQVLANTLLVLMDGAYIVARMFGVSPDNPAAHASMAAQQVIVAECGRADGRITASELRVQVAPSQCRLSPALNRQIALAIGFIAIQI